MKSGNNFRTSVMQKCIFLAVLISISGILSASIPDIGDECRYEGNIERAWVQLTGQELTRQFWTGALNGCYAGHGECTV